MNRECKFHPGRGLFQGYPVCSTCWFGIPEATRKTLVAGLIDRETFMRKAEEHFKSVQEFGGGHRVHEKE